MERGEGWGTGAPKKASVNFGGMFSMCCFVFLIRPPLLWLPAHLPSSVMGLSFIGFEFECIRLYIDKGRKGLRGSLLLRKLLWTYVIFPGVLVPHPYRAYEDGAKLSRMWAGTLRTPPWKERVKGVRGEKVNWGEYCHDPASRQCLRWHPGSRGGPGLGEGRMGTSTALGGGRQARWEMETGGGVSWLLLAPSVGFLHIIYRSLDSNQGKLAHTWGRPGLPR